MVDDVRATEAEFENLTGEQQSLEDAVEVWNAHKHIAKSLRHDHIVEQRVADGHVAVIRHGRQNEEFTDDEHKEEWQLYGTCIERNGFVIHKKIHQHLWADGRGIPKINESQVSDEKVHRCV